MRYAAALLALALACARPQGEAQPPAPTPAPETPTAPALVRRHIEPFDPPPVFTDPRRRERLEAALPAVEAYLDEAVERDGLVGLAAAIVIDGEIAWVKLWGHRDPAKGLPVERDTLFGVGSISKTATTLALLKLRDDGVVDLDRPAAAYLAELDRLLYPTTDSPAITLRHILTHASGLPRMGNFPEYPETSPDRAAFLDTLHGLALERPPGSRRVYSNLGFQLLGPLLDEVTGRDHREFTIAEVLRPMGIEGAVWSADAAPTDKLAVGHERGPDGQPRPRPPWRPGAADAAGGLYLSIDDLARYVAHNLAAWPARSDPEAGPLRRATLREAHTLQRLTNLRFRPGDDGANAQASGTGLGFGIFANCEHDYVVGHAGKTLNYRAALLMLPERGVGVALLSNHSSISSQVLPADAQRVLDILAETGALAAREHRPAADLVAAAEAVGDLLGRWDVDAYTRTFSASYRDTGPEDASAETFRRWGALVGACAAPRARDLSEPRAGVLDLECARGTLELDLRVGPWAERPVTALRFVGARGIDEPVGVRDAATRALALMARWDVDEHGRLFADNLGVARIQGFFHAVHAALGRCEIGALQHVRPRGASYTLTCERGSVLLQLSLDEQSPAKITSFTIRDEPSASPCG